jgi:hypothetical protein
MMIRLDQAHGLPLIVADDGRDILIQADWDFPGLASTFGWVACHCRATDGTVPCPHRTVDAMMSAARTFLDDNIGKTVEDPGYF